SSRQPTLRIAFISSPRKKYLRSPSLSMSGRGLGILQGIVEALIALGRAAFDEAPAIVVLPEGDGRLVFNSRSVKRSPHFIERNPLPKKIHVGRVSVLADSGDPRQLPAGHGNVEVWRVFGTAWNQIADGLHSNRSERDLPTRWGRNLRRATVG